MADINGIAEQSLVSSNFCTKVSRMEDNDCCPNEGTYPDLLLSQGRSYVAGKRGRYEIQNKKVNGEGKPQFLEVTCTRASHVKYVKSLGQGSSTTHYDSEEENGVHNPIVVSPSLQTISSVDKRSNFSSSEKGLILNPIDISDDKKGGAVPSEIPTGFLYPANCNNTEITENLSAEKPVSIPFQYSAQNWKHFSISNMVYGMLLIRSMFFPKFSIDKPRCKMKENMGVFHFISCSLDISVEILQKFMFR